MLFYKPVFNFAFGRYLTNAFHLAFDYNSKCSEYTVADNFHGIGYFLDPGIDTLKNSRIIVIYHLTAKMADHNPAEPSPGFATAANTIIKTIVPI